MKTGKTSAVLATALLLGAAATGLWLTTGHEPVSGRTAHQASFPIPNPKPSPLHPVVSRIIHEGPELAYLRFNYLIKELPLHLATHDIEALIAFISGPRPSAFQEAEWGSLVNDIEENLTVQTVPSPRVADALIAIYRDETKIQMQRDYALQHIGGFLIYIIHTGARNSSRPSPSSSQHLSFSAFQLLLAELKTAASDSSKPWSGTALNLLDGCLRAAEYRQSDIPGMDVDPLVSLALPVARDPAAPLNARLPALQLAARRDSPAARDLAREILLSQDSGVMLTQSASAVLARLGTQDDLALLQTASAGSTRHTAPAINQAIRAIQSRLQIN